jgi:hypothetical protein
MIKKRSKLHPFLQATEQKKKQHRGRRRHVICKFSNHLQRTSMTKTIARRHILYKSMLRNFLFTNYILWYLGNDNRTEKTLYLSILQKKAEAILQIKCQQLVKECDDLLIGTVKYCQDMWSQQLHLLALFLLTSAKLTGK